jgi:hypothetical protein
MACHDLRSHQVDACQENAGHSSGTSTSHGHTLSEVMDRRKESFTKNCHEVVSSNHQENAGHSIDLVLDLDHHRLSSNCQENAGRSLEVVDCCKDLLEVMDHRKEFSMKNSHEIISSNPQDNAGRSLEVMDRCKDLSKVSLNHQENAGRSLLVVDCRKDSLE